MSFLISSLSRSHFEHLFVLGKDELSAFGAVRMVATKKPGFPCRVSLADAEIGEEVILVHYEHQAANTPFRSSHAVYVRQSAAEAHLNVNEVPELLRSRILSLRAFDQTGMMVEADLAEGTALEAAIESMLQKPAASYIHLHFAKPGCYAARVDRA
jgi:hypothetical protein